MSIKKRQEIPKKIQDEILTKAKHRCCICGNSGVQLHHIDENPKNNEIGNIAVLCAEHHAEVHGNLTKKITPSQLRLYMAFLFSDMQQFNDINNFWDGKNGIRTLRAEEAMDRFFDLSSEIIQFIYENKQDFKNTNKDQEKHLLDLYKLLSKIIRKFELFIKKLQRMKEWTSNKKYKFVDELLNEIRNFGKILSLVNTDILDIYSPGLGKELLSIIGRDLNLFFYVADKCERFERGKESYKDHILALFAEHFNGDGFWELEFHARCGLSWSNKGTTIEKLNKMGENSLKKLKKCQILFQKFIKEHWRLNEVYKL